MKILRALATLPCLAIACCAPVPQPTPPSAASVTPTPSPERPSSSVLAEPAYDNWIDAPATPGDWNYRDGNALSFATFATSGSAALFGIECSKANRTVSLVRGSSMQGPVPMRIRTETAERLVTANSAEDGRPMLIATLSSNDGLLDAMALSRGRFAVETAGLPTLYIPAWPEITRVIEDCR